jgi:hypothetical protein
VPRFNLNLVTRRARVFSPDTCRSRGQKHGYRINWDSSGTVRSSQYVRLFLEHSRSRPRTLPADQVLRSHSCQNRLKSFGRRHSGELGETVDEPSRNAGVSGATSDAAEKRQISVKSLTEALAHTLRNIADCRIKAHLLIPSFTYIGNTAKRMLNRPAAAWSPDQVVERSRDWNAANSIYSARRMRPPVNRMSVESSGLRAISWKTRPRCPAGILTTSGRSTNL